jgi:cyclic-di-GMP-binding protein
VEPSSLVAPVRHIQARKPGGAEASCVRRNTRIERCCYNRAFAGKNITPLEMPDNSFDVVSKIEIPEVSNAIQQSLKELGQRFDLKDSHSSIELNEKDSKIVLASQDEFKIKAVNDILTGKLVKRKVPLKGLVYGDIAPAAGSTVRQEITLQQGIPIEKAREIVKKVKDSKLKVQASIQGDFVRVSGRDRDTLQQAIALLRGADFGIDMQFTNYRTN